MQRLSIAPFRNYALRDQPLQRQRKVDPGWPGHHRRLRDLIQNNQPERDKVSRMDSAAGQQVVGNTVTITAEAMTTKKNRSLKECLSGAMAFSNSIL